MKSSKPGAENTKTQLIASVPILLTASSAPHPMSRLDEDPILLFSSPRYRLPTRTHAEAIAERENDKVAENQGVLSPLAIIYTGR
jgi:hypothetical protein